MPQRKNSKTRQYFNDWAGDYDRTVKSGRWTAPCHVFESVKPYTGKTSKILDVAIGTGLLSAHFRKKSADIRITGLDISEAMIKQCARKGKIANSLIVCDVEHQKFPVPDSSYDLTVASGVFEFLPTVKNILAEMARVTQPGGIIAFSYTPNAGSKTRLHEDADSPDDLKIYSQSSREIEKIMSRHGVRKLAVPSQFVSYKLGGHSYTNKVFVGQLVKKPRP